MPNWPLSTKAFNLSWTALRSSAVVLRLGEISLASLAAFWRIGREGAGHVHPVQGVEVIEMDDMVVHELAG